ncbi:unnamed protein product [Acanthoscelides obtectus]|uniref:Uncharacterized protein n=1 Tax=Acanthoscelides obtectus TaxID=200917 RepID=A0A9P0P4G5_ACAOB|nr:unnamed protein product [Acanthoscelides obtectus]CAK1656025.1 hypothetical protein AOBTE_LOCUS19524 [Acanthoscelides obtectus]
MSRNTVWLLSTHLNFRFYRRYDHISQNAKLMQDGERDVRNNMSFLLSSTGSVGMTLIGSDACSKAWLPNAACSMCPNVIELKKLNVLYIKFHRKCTRLNQKTSIYEP